MTARVSRLALVRRAMPELDLEVGGGSRRPGARTPALRTGAAA